jgi:DNA-binding response OmpR family regulator
MPTETILLIDDRQYVRDAVARPYTEAGARVEDLATCAEAIELLARLRPDWILVGEQHATELLLWLRDRPDRVDIPVMVLPDLQTPPRGREHGGREPRAA